MKQRDLVLLRCGLKSFGDDIDPVFFHSILCLAALQAMIKQEGKMPPDRYMARAVASSWSSALPSPVFGDGGAITSTTSSKAVLLSHVSDGNWP